jgi:hypothetical protein
VSFSRKRGQQIGAESFHQCIKVVEQVMQAAFGR